MNENHHIIEYLNSDLPFSVVAKYIAHRAQIAQNYNKISDKISHFLDSDYHPNTKWDNFALWVERSVELVEEYHDAFCLFIQTAEKLRKEQAERAAKRAENRARKLYENLKIQFDNISIDKI